MQRIVAHGWLNTSRDCAKTFAIFFCRQSQKLKLLTAETTCC